MRRVRIGCSGWSYDDWRGGLYPDDLPKRRWLERYAEVFDTVEVNATFYRLPKRSTVESWVEQVPGDFLFAVKASRYLTHMKRLRGIADAVARFWDPLEPLRRGRRLGPVLWQLPESFRRDDDLLSAALDQLPRARHCFEFRAKLRGAAAGCRGCALWKDATQTVFGAGPRKLMLVGEQPGDREDIEGEPFVGPAGGVLARALESAGIDAEGVYLTNAVKHFKWRARGKRRLHQTPRAGEVEACRPWLEAELKAVRPTGLLAMGATAAKALFGPSVHVTRDRGRLIDSPLAPVAALTLHPSAVLRLRDHDEREDALDGLIKDLRFLADSVAKKS